MNIHLKRFSCWMQQEASQCMDVLQQRWRLFEDCFTSICLMEEKKSLFQEIKHFFMGFISGSNRMVQKKNILAFIFGR